MTTDTTTVPTGIPVDVPLADIRDNPRQVRRDVGDVAELAASIQQYGLLQPVVLIPADDGEPGYWPVAGHRRVAAARLAGMTTIAANVLADAGSHGHQILGMLIENGQRRPLTPIEEAEGVQAVLDLGETDYRTVAKIARVTGRPASTLRQRVALNALPDAVKAKLHLGQIPLESANALAEFADDQDLLAALTKALGTYNFNYALEQARRQRQFVRDRAKVRKEMEAKGLKVIDQPEDWTTIQPLHWLRTQGGDVIDQDEHARSCPHHAVYISRYSADHGTCCLDPVAGGHRVPSSERPSAPPVDTAYERLEAARKERLAIGRKLRAEHQSALPMRQPDMQLDVLRLYLRWAVPAYLADRGGAGSWTMTGLADIKELAAIFGVEIPVPPRPSARSEGTKAQMERDLEAARDTWGLFRPAIEEATAEQCLRAILSMLRRDVESRLDFRHGDRREVGMAYLALLTAHGYELSDAEREDLHLSTPDEDDDGEPTIDDSTASGDVEDVVAAEEREYEPQEPYAKYPVGDRRYPNGAEDE